MNRRHQNARAGDDRLAGVVTLKELLKLLELKLNLEGTA
jgi:hypothetical protein